MQKISRINWRGTRRAQTHVVCFYIHILRVYIWTDASVTYVGIYIRVYIRVFVCSVRGRVSAASDVPLRDNLEVSV